MNNTISIVQGDTSCTYKFQRKYDDGSVITTLPEKMWITFKKNYGCKETIFQKTLNNGIDFDEEHYYKFKLMPEDTCNLCCRDYGFDIAIINERGEKKTLLNDGVLRLEEHYTHKENEV